LSKEGLETNGGVEAYLAHTAKADPLFQGVRGCIMCTPNHFSGDQKTNFMRMLSTAASF